MKKIRYFWLIIPVSCSLQSMTKDIHEQAKVTALCGTIQQNNPSLLISLMPTHQAVIPSNGYTLLYTVLHTPIQINTNEIDHQYRQLPLEQKRLPHAWGLAFQGAFRMHSHNAQQTLQLLIGAGASINHPYNGTTILHEAVKLAIEHGGEMSTHYNELVRTALLYGANPFARNSTGMTALQVIQKTKSNNSLEKILQNTQTYIKKQALAFLMAQHVRTGALSPATGLPSDLFKEIARIFIES